MNGRRADAEESLVRIRDLAGRARGTGFLLDDRGTLITSHEAVDGLARLVLHAQGELTCVVGAENVTVLPEFDLALVRTEGLCVPPLPVAAAERVEGGKEVRLRAGLWQSARVVGDVPVTYTATDRFHLLGTALELSLSERAGLRLGEEATGGPVFDATTGAVVAVLGTALQAERRASGFAIPLRAAALAAPGGPLAAVLDRNAATVPAYGPDLNLAGALQLTATALGSVVTPRVWRDPVERPETEREFARFLDVEPGDATEPYVLGLVGDPGTGRTTELGALAGRRARGAEPAPTLWLRGADLMVGDESVRDAIERALKAAGRIVTASAGPGGTIGDTAAATPESVAELARRMGRPLLVLLDGPEEMPPVLAHGLPEWTAATARWLRRHSARLIVACRPEHWETAGALFPAGALHAPGGHCAPPATSGPALPPCTRIADLTPAQAAEVRASHAIPPDAIDPADADHPLTLRLLAEIRAALPDGTEGAGGSGEAAPDRWDVFTAYLDLVCLRIAVRLAAARRPPLRGPAVRRLAARVAGQVHEAARRCLGPGQGELEREAFEELFPWRTGWASAVLTEGLLVPAGAGYRFAHEEFADWLQGAHLDLDAALHALVHRWYEPEGPPAEAAVRLPSRSGGGPAPAPKGHVPPPPGSAAAGRPGAARRRKRGDRPEPPTLLPVPRHRIGPVLQALLLLARRSGPTELSRRLSALVHAVETLAQRAEKTTGRTRTADRTATSGDKGLATQAASAADQRKGAAARKDAAARDESVRAVSDPSWWAAHLLGEALLRVPDATPYLCVLRLLAERVTARSLAVGGFDGEDAHKLGGLAEFGPWFWLRLPLRLADRLELLRILLPADGPPPGAAPDRGPDDAEPTGRRALEATEGEPGEDRPAGDDDQPAPVAAGTGARVPGQTRRPGTRRRGEDAAATARTATVPGQRTAGEAGDDQPGPPQADRFLTAVAGLLTTDPCAAQPLICRWFTDDRPLQTAPEADGVKLTVSTAAQALLHTHRRRAIDDLAEALVEAGHPRADELLSDLAEDEPSALCRAVDRWAHDERVERHVAAAAYGLKAAPHVTTEADRELLRFSALAMLDRPSEVALHGTALALLVGDRETRARHLPQALARFAAGDHHLTPQVLAPALATHPEPVLAAFRARLYEPGERPAAVLRTLAGVTAPALARRVAALVREHVEHRPEGAQNAAAFVDRRLEEGPAARAVLFPLVVDLVRTRPAHVRRALAPVLASPGTPLSRPLRQELLEVLMEREEYGPYEREVTVLDTLLRAVAEGAAERTEARTRDLVHRTGLLMARTPEGAACFDRRLTQLAREVPVFGDQVRGWLKSAPAQWAVVVGPSARIRLTAGREKGDGRGKGGSKEPAEPADVTTGTPADAGRRQPAWHS
ncbi:serine protease [Streptomyces cinnamoneus]|uniref:serine protease n=1 Tax=Streptomyces cinnamoneus TaxID=53446 RepID=UPI00378C7346